MRRATPLSFIVTLLAFAALGAPAAFAHSGYSPVVGHVYVNDNTAGSNAVAAFARHADGSLSSVPGSPFATGGAGNGTGTGSQGALQESASGHYLLAVDAGSNQISVLRIAPDGSLRQVPGGTVPAGGAEPVSIAVHRHLVYVANDGAGASNYTGFVFWGGHLFPLPGSTYALPDTAQPGDVLFNATGTLLAGTRVGTSQIDSFAVSRDGRLRPAAGSPFSAQGVGPFGSEFRPTNPNQLFVSNAHGGPGAGTVSAFRVASDGTLSSIGASPFADDQTAPCWVEISHDGRFLFTVNTAVPSISRYAISPGGALTLLGSTPFSGGASGPFDARLSPDGDTLWVVDDASAQVSAFRVDGGNLTELPSSPTALPTGATPFGIVVN
ncbi:MAG TPA: beta-propeller fold lactonase family protein [Solirubrobacteraceae bacterium]|jgi:6-phosphogluconolactonase (cycloisomerase 2 family)|nr:beta-propeller fold lactonase family protein [Solirubrobacteraceae bacterium]